MTNPTNQPDTFLEFLLEKGYPSESILEYPIDLKLEQTSDIVIKDPISKRYLAIIDKVSEKKFDINKSSNQLMNYGKSIVTPIYVVVYSSTDFNIYGLEEFGLVPISKPIFPTYDNLIKIAQENIYRRLNSIHIKKIKEDEAKKKGFLSFAISTITIMIISVAATLLFDTSGSSSKEKIKNNHQLNIEQKAVQAKLDSLIYKLSKLRKSSVTKSDTIYIDSSKTYRGLEKRLEVIEKGISENPEKALAIVNIKHELLLIRQGISELESNNAMRNEYIQKQIDSTRDLADNTLFLLIGAILSAIVGIVMAFKPDLFKRKKSQELPISRTESEW